MDHISDKNHSNLYQIYTSMSVPSYVKEASLLEATDRFTMSADQFADRVNGNYPISSKADTWLSSVFYLKHASVSNEAIEGRLKEAATLWDIDFEALRSELTASMSKQASTSPAFTVKVAVNGDVLANLTITDKSQISKLADEFFKSASKYPLTTRKSVAEQLLQAISTFKASVSNEQMDNLEKYAGQGTTTPENALLALRLRKSICRSRLPEFTEKLAEIEGSLEKTAAEFVQPAILHKTAAILDVIDRFTDMHTKYNDNFKSPEHSLFNVTPTKLTIMQKKAVKLSSGEVFSADVVMENADYITKKLADICNFKVAAVEDLPKELEKLDTKFAKIAAKVIEACVD
jgi:hypothetical protein